jgi:alkanesulfonate monooxygenase SsuD/methylene tetrahydromethanopterin reductase-like flavin-dependent oxidoreductase (luciferase family)
VGSDLEQVRCTVRNPLREYLRSAIRLEQTSARAGGRISGGHALDAEDLGDSDTEELLDIAFEKYFNTSALMGTPEMCIETVQRLKAIGVDEIACLIDFGVESDSVLRSLEILDSVRERFTRKHSETALNSSSAAFLEPLEV